MLGVAVRVFAKQVGVSSQAVRKAMENGRISVEPDGTIDPIVGAVEWVANRNPLKAPMGVDDLTNAQANTLLRNSRARKESYLAERARLELEQVKGSLMPVADVAKLATAASRRTKDQLRALAPRLAAAILGLTDLQEATRVVEDEMRRICEENATGLGASDDEVATTK